MRQGMALLFLFFDWRQRIVSYPVESFPVLKFYFEHLEFKRPFHSLNFGVSLQPDDLAVLD